MKSVMTDAELKVATEVIAKYDMRNATTLDKCKELAMKVLDAAENVRKRWIWHA